MNEKTESLPELKPKNGDSADLDLRDSTDTKSAGSKNKTTLFSHKKLILLTGFILAIGISFYCLMLSHNAMQAFIPYDEDKVLDSRNSSSAGSLPSKHINFQGHEHTLTGQLTQRMANMEQKLQQLVTQQRNANRLWDRESTNLDPVKDQMAVIVQKIARLEQQLNQMIADQKKVVVVYATFEQLKDAVNQGNVFESILNRLYDLIPADGDIRNLLQTLAEYSSVGAASYQQLHEELAVILSKQKQDVIHASSSNDGWWTRAASLLKSVIKFHKIDGPTVHQSVNLGEAYDKITVLLSKSDVKSSIDVLAPFEKILSPAEINFYHQLIARMTVDDCLNRIDQILLSARFLQTLNSSP